MNPYAKKGLPVRMIYLVMAIVWWLGGGCGWRHRRKTVVLCYHNVTSGQRATFSKQMRMIEARAVEFESMDTRSVVRKPGVCVTFDDAFVGIRKHALPELDRYGIQATVFVPTGCLGRSPTWSLPQGHADRDERILSDAECRELDASDWVRFESHSVSHPRLTLLDTDDCKRELVESKTTLESLLGREVNYLALPHGDGDDRVFNMARRAGYERVFTIEPGFHDSKTGSFFVKRFSVSPDMWAIEFRLTIDGAYSWLSPWRRVLRGIRTSLGRQRDRNKIIGAAS